MAVEPEEGKQTIRHDKYNGHVFEISLTTIHLEVQYTALGARFVPTCSTRSSFPLDEYIKLRLKSLCPGLHEVTCGPRFGLKGIEISSNPT